MAKAELKQAGSINSIYYRMTVNYAGHNPDSLFIKTTKGEFVSLDTGETVSGADKFATPLPKDNLITINT